MVKVSNSGTTDTEKTEHDVAAPSAIARSQSHHNRHTHLPAIPPSQPPPPPTPPHDDEEVVLQFLDVEETSRPLPDTPHHSPPPLPSKKTFYDKNNGKLPHANNEGSPMFLKKWMARYPILARHPRRFVALLFTIGTLLLLLIILLSIRLSQGDPNNGGSGGGGWIGDSRGGTFPIDPKTEQDLRKHNRGLTKPPINRSNEPGWTSSGRGDGTYYDPSVRNSAGGFQQGACEFEYINSVTEYIVALNKPDFGPFPRASKSPACGQCLKVTGPGGTVQVQVVDMCPSCKSGALDLSPAAFAKIAHIDQGRVPISWERCP